MAPCVWRRRGDVSVRRDFDKTLARAPSGAEPTQRVSSAGEASLLARLQAGDEDAYRELLRTHGSRLLAVARRLMRNEEDARDCLQDAFLSAFRAIGRFEGNSKLGTWLH